MIEAPRGVLVHHYRVNPEGAIVWANLIVATGHNNPAMNESIKQVAKEYVHAEKLEEGMLNPVSAVIRACDPCLNGSTHASGQIARSVRLLAKDGALLHKLKR